jgi:oxygen-independent coproporphyrinogen III oxidase
MTISDAEVRRVAHALGDAPAAAYTAPLVYPWAVRNFVSRPLAERPPVSGPMRLYVHVPFCNYRCTFCAFAVRVGAGEALMERYVAAVGRELDRVAAVDASLVQLFVGGGTPTALPPRLLDALLERVLRSARVGGELAHTVEASPESIEDGHLEVLRERGIARVSMGVESMEPAVLDTVRRRHTPEQALEACRRIVASGLVLNVDLLYGLPRQTADGFRRDLEQIAATGAHSVCLYALRVSEATPVRTALADEETLDLARSIGWRALAARAAAECGFVGTRTYLFERRDRVAARESGFAIARPPGATAHLGVGMSARSQIRGVVYRNHDRLETYVERVERDASPVETVFELDEADRKTQFVAVHLGNGLALWRAGYERAFGAPIEQDFGELVARLTAAELLADDGVRLELTETGRLVYDRVLLCFYPERARRWLQESVAAGARPS